MTKIFHFCTHCATGLTPSDDLCAACGHETIDAHRIVHMQSESRANRRRPRGAAASAFAVRPRPTAP